MGPPKSSKWPEQKPQALLGSGHPSLLLSAQEESQKAWHLGHSLSSVMEEIREKNIQDGGRKYFVIPMNCPHFENHYTI